MSAERPATAGSWILTRAMLFVLGIELVDIVGRTVSHRLSTPAILIHAVATLVGVVVVFGIFTAIGAFRQQQFALRMSPVTMFVAGLVVGVLELLVGSGGV